MIRVMVTGGRNYQGRDNVFGYLDLIHRGYGIGEIIHGACGWNADSPGTMFENGLSGADRWADEWARENRVRVTRVPAHWSIGGRAGPLRNAAMIALAPSQVIAFPGGPGTKNARELAQASGIPVYEWDEKTQLVLTL